MAGQNVAKLGIEIDASNGEATVKRLGGELERLATAGDKVSRTTKQQEQELRKLAEISRSLGDIQGKQFQTLIRLNGGQEKFLQIQRQIDEELRVADQVAKQYEQTTQQVVKAKDGATAASNRLRSGFATLASQVAGTNPVVGQLASTLSSFAVGSAVTVGVLAGVSAMGLAFRGAIEVWKEAKRESDSLIESLAAQARASREAANALPIAQANLRNAQGKSGIGGGLTTGLATAVGGAGFGAFIGTGEATARALELQKAIDAVQGAKDKAASSDDEIFQKKLAAENAIREALEGGDAVLKGIDERRKKEQNEELSRLKAKLDLLLKINGLPDLSALTANIDARLSLGGTPDVLRRGSAAGAFGLLGGVRVNFPTDPKSNPALEAQSRANVEWERANAQRILAEGKAEKSISKLDRSAQIAGQALEYYLVNKFGGGGIGSSLGASVGKSLTAGASAFGSEALGAAIFGPIGAAAGAAVGGLFDLGAKAHEAGRILKQMQDEASKSAAEFMRQTKGYDSLDDKLADALREFNEAAAKIAEAFDGREEENRINELYADYQRRREKIVAQDAEEQRYAGEDLEVRRLRATGKDTEADRLALINRQQQELFEAEQQGKDAEYIARLKEIQALERSKEALDEMSKSALNLVSGYRYQNTIFNNAPINPFGPEIQGGWEGTPPVQPKTFPTATASVSSGDLTVNVMLPDGSVLATTVVKNLQSKAQRKFGDTRRWSEVQS